MLPRPILLYRRRWTLVSQVPFALLMAACCACAVYFAWRAQTPVVAAFFWLGAFGTFCIAGSLGHASLNAYRLREPALVIDETGITDLRDTDPRTLPWQAMQRVVLDNYENAILVRLVPAPDTSLLRAITDTLRRWQLRGDAVFSLGGLGYDANQLRTSLQAFHRAACPPSLAQHPPVTADGSASTAGGPAPR